MPRGFCAEVDKHIEKSSSDSDDSDSSGDSANSSVEASPCSIEDEGMCVDEFMEEEIRPTLLAAVDKSKHGSGSNMGNYDCAGVRNQQKSSERLLTVEQLKEMLTFSFCCQCYEIGQRQQVDDLQSRKEQLQQRFEQIYGGRKSPPLAGFETSPTEKMAHLRGNGKQLN